MCGILFTNKDISSYDINHIIEFLKKRGPDSINIKKIKKYTFVHTLLSMTGPLTTQPFYNHDKSVLCIFNGEIYNFEQFGNYNSDGECLIPLYEKYDNDFIKKLDGEFAIILVDFTKNIIILSTDIFSTRPLWIGYDNDNNYGISTYQSCLDRIKLKYNFQVLANNTMILDLENFNIIDEKKVHIFDLRQFKTSFDDWNKAFSESIKKRTKYAKCGIFIGMSGGYDSGAIACELTKQNIEFTAYSISNVEDKNIMKLRGKKVKKSEIFDIDRNSFLEARDFLKKNCEEYKLNIDNGETEKYLSLISNKYYDQNDAKKLFDLINFRKNGQILTDDNGAIGCSYICSLAKKKNEKIYLSGSGADEIFSDYGFNKVKFFNHSSIGGFFTDDLNDIFPWKNFFSNTQRAYLMKEEYVAGSYGIEGRYPFLDKYVVQEFLWLTPELKNKNYKSPLDNYLTINNFPYEKNQKTGFGCGFRGPNIDNKSYSNLTSDDIKKSRESKVTDIKTNMIVNFTNYTKKSYENYYFLDKKLIIHVKDNMYLYKININYIGNKYNTNCKYYLMENNVKIGKNEKKMYKIAKYGKGLFYFRTCRHLYFSTSNNSNPILNDKLYSIDTYE